jgi:hypothetical protein
VVELLLLRRTLHLAVQLQAINETSYIEIDHIAIAIEDFPMVLDVMPM